jgi:hypothetical protein
MILATATRALLAVLLLDTFLHAPFEHFHPGDPAHDHDHRFVHHEHSSLPAFECPDHDEDAQWCDWLGDDAGLRGFTEVVLCTTTAPGLLNRRAAARALVRPRAHDPPVRGIFAPRAPPISL